MINAIKLHELLDIVQKLLYSKEDRGYYKVGDRAWV